MNSTATKPATTGTITGIDLVGYLVKDPDRMVAFYRDVLGMTPTDIDEEGRGAEFTLGDGSTFGLWKPDEGTPTGSAIMFAVADINAAVAQFGEAGAKLSPPIETPVCFMSFSEDPEGNSIIIHQRKVHD